MHGVLICVKLPASTCQRSCRVRVITILR